MNNITNISPRSTDRLYCTRLVNDILLFVIRPMIAAYTALGEDGVLNIREAGFTPLPDIFTVKPVSRLAYGPKQVEDLLKYYSEFCRKGVKAAEENVEGSLEKEAVLDVIRASKAAFDKVRFGGEFKRFLEYEGKRYLIDEDVLVMDD